MNQTVSVMNSGNLSKDSWPAAAQYLNQIMPVVNSWNYFNYQATTSITWALHTNKKLMTQISPDMVIGSYFK